MRRQTIKFQHIKQKQFIFFFNNLRGIEIIKYLIKKKNFYNYKIILAKKFLNIDILKILKKLKIEYTFINSLKNKKLTKIIKSSDLCIVCGFPYIFNKKQLNFSKKGFINCHAGWLPYYRGGSPLNWQLINNEKKFGISVIKLNEKIDGGDIIETKNFFLHKHYTINHLHKIANKSFPKLVLKSIIKTLNNVKPKKQIETKSRYFKQRNQEDSLLKFENMKYVDVDCFVRALQKPYPNAYIKYLNQIIKIEKLKKINKKLSQGQILIKKNKVFLGCKDSAVQLIKFKIS